MQLKELVVDLINKAEQDDYFDVIGEFMQAEEERVHEVCREEL